jgi:hypothetical protein
VNSQISNSDLKGKDASDTTTTINIQTTNAMIDSVNSTSELRKLSVEDTTIKNLFSATEPEDINLRVGKERLKNIFDKEYKKAKEIQEYHFFNIYLYSNLLANILLRTSTSLSRPVRIFLLYSYIYFLMFWSAIFIASSTSKLTHPEQQKDVIFLVASNVWILFVSPLLATIMIYLVAGMLKIDESRIQEADTIKKYQEVM